MLTRSEEIFGKEIDKCSQDAEAREAELYRQIGQLKVELDWLKKKICPLPLRIRKGCLTLSIRQYPCVGNVHYWD